MVFAVGVLVSGHGAVGHAERQVGVGIEGPLAVPFAQTLYISSIKFVEDFAVEVAQRLGSQHPRDMVEHTFGLFAQSDCGLHGHAVGAFPYGLEKGVGVGFRRFVTGHAFGVGGRAVNLRATAVFAERMAPERLLGELAPGEALFGPFFGGVGCRQRRERFARDFVSEIGVHDPVVLGAQAHHYAGVFGTSHGPQSELRLVIEFRCDGSAAVDAQRFALPFFPGVGDRGVLGGVVDAQRGVGLW